MTLVQNLRATVSNSGTMTTAIGASMMPITGGGTIGTYYGLRIEATTAQTITTRYGISQEDTAAINVLASATRVGATTAPATNTLDVSTAGWGVKLPSTPGATGAGTENILDCYAEADWTPVDKSGASLAITFTNAKVTRIGRVVHCCFVATYPSTASALSAKISLPFACTGTDAAPLYPGTAAIGFNNSTATNMIAQVVSDTTTGTYLYFHNPAADVPNSTMSTKAIQVSVTYQIY
jgi:hypothetical protein